MDAKVKGFIYVAWHIVGYHCASNVEGFHICSWCYWTSWKCEEVVDVNNTFWKQQKQDHYTHGKRVKDILGA